MNNNTTKNLNKNQVLLKILTNDAPISRIYLSRKLKLSKMTLSNIINEFISNKYLCEKGCLIRPTVGPKPILLDIDEEAPKAIGLSIQRSKITVTVTDMKLNVLFFETQPTEKNFKLPDIENIIDSLLDKALAFLGDQRLLGIGVTTPGPIDQQHNLILNPGDFYGIRNYDIVSFIKRKTTADVIFTRDIWASTLLEKMYGNGKSLDNFILLAVDKGISIGIVEDKKFYQKYSSLSGELGHSVINFKGPKCHCGRRGCLERYVNFDDILQKAAKKNALDNLSLKELFQIAKKDPEIDKMIKEALYYLSIGLINTCNLLNPSKIILSSGIVMLDEIYKNYLQELLNNSIVKRDIEEIEIGYSKFNKNIYSLSSASIVMGRFVGEF